VVDIRERRLLCTCRPCALLFERPASGVGRLLRTVPDRVLRDAGEGPAPADWDALEIPVGVAFFLRNGADGEVSAFYPSPAGATECLLDLDAWRLLAANCPVIEQAEPDVEAVLARRTTAGVECYVVPVDSCYEFVGRLRLLWKGFDGGQEARAALLGFFEDLRRRSRPFPAVPAVEVIGGSHG
jgi:hypothetical protein